MAIKDSYNPAPKPNTTNSALSSLGVNPVTPKPAAKPATSTPKLSATDLKDLANAQAELASSTKQLEELRKQASGVGSNTNTGGAVTPSTSAADQFAAQQALLLKQQQASQAAADQGYRQSAYDLLLNEFNKYGLGSLVEPLKGLIQSNISPSQFALELQNTDAYKQRFSANQDRISKGLRALSPAEYIGLEDQYQNIMRNYGLPANYYAKDSMGTQSGFNQLLGNDVSAAELEDRVMTAQSRVVNANPETMQALKQFYPGITNGDILAYSLDPTKALTDIKRKVTAAEIGGAALGQGLSTSQTSAEGLAAAGVTKAQAQQGYSNIAEFLPTGEKLSQIYQESPYTQTQAEQEIFNLADSAAAAKKRKRLSQLETGTFGGSSGTSGGALSRDRAFSPYMLGTPGAGSY
jgi:hypothetical protein